MANIIRLLNFLKWNTDQNHRLTQEKIRIQLGKNSKHIIGDKNTFKRLLFLIADSYNTNITETGTSILKDESDWSVIFPGYKINKIDISSTIKNSTQNTHSYYTGPIYFHHKISHPELRFLIMQLNCIDQKRKSDLILRLISEIGNKHFCSEDLTTINSSNINTKLQLFDFSTHITRNFFENITTIQDAINREKLISFYTSKINNSGEIVPLSDEYLVSPYRIVSYNGHYWLIGNRRLNSYIAPYDNLPKYHYSNTLDIYRIDKLVNVSIKEKRKRAKVHFNNINLEKCINILSSKIHIFKEHTKIVGTDITQNYGEIEFEILWNNFSSSTPQNDYSFIYDTFGKNYSVRHEDQREIVCVQAATECFIDWALVNIDKIKILDTKPNSSVIINKLIQRLSIGLKNLK